MIIYFGNFHVFEGNSKKTDFCLIVILICVYVCLMYSAIFKHYKMLLVYHSDTCMIEVV